MNGVQLNLLDPQDDGLPDPKFFEVEATTEQLRKLGTRDAVRYFLEHFEEARGEDKLVVFLYWWHVDGLKEYLSMEQGRWLLHFLLLKSTKQAETIRRRRAEIHELRAGTGSLLPPRHVVERRKEQDGAGAPKGTERSRK